MKGHFFFMKSLILSSKNGVIETKQYLTIMES